MESAASTNKGESAVDRGQRVDDPQKFVREELRKFGVELRKSAEPERGRTTTMKKRVALTNLRNLGNQEEEEEGEVVADGPQKTSHQFGGGPPGKRVKLMESNSAPPVIVKQEPLDEDNDDDDDEVPPQPPAHNRAIHYTLNEFKEYDNHWLNQQAERNDSRNRDKKTNFPAWQIVSQKWIRLQFHWATGEVTVILEAQPKAYTTSFTGIRMTTDQWNQLVSLMPTIREYIQYSEIGQPWQALTAGSLTMTKVSPFGTVSQVRMKAFDMTYVTLTALDEVNNKGGCQVDVREFVKDKENPSKLIPIRRGLTLIGGGFDYLARFLVPKVSLLFLFFSL